MRPTEYPDGTPDPDGRRTRYIRETPERQHRLNMLLLAVAVVACAFAVVAFILAATAHHNAGQAQTRVGVLETAQASQHAADSERDKRAVQTKDLACVLANRAGTPDPQLAQARRDLGCAGVAPTPTFAPRVGPTR